MEKNSGTPDPNTYADRVAATSAHQKRAREAAAAEKAQVAKRAAEKEKRKKEAATKMQSVTRGNLTRKKTMGAMNATKTRRDDMWSKGKLPPGYNPLNDPGWDRMNEWIYNMWNKQTIAKNPEQQRKWDFIKMKIDKGDFNGLDGSPNAFQIFNSLQSLEPGTRNSQIKDEYLVYKSKPTKPAQHGGIKTKRSRTKRKRTKRKRTKRSRTKRRKTKRRKSH